MEPAPPVWLDLNLWPFPGRFHALPAGRLHVTDVGVGPPVLFVHGTPTWSIDWRHVITGLVADHRCIAADHLGFGLSDRPFGAGYRPEDHAERFAVFADSLDLRDLTLVVHDFGGPIALPWAVRNRQRLRRLVVLNTWAWPFDDRVQRMGARLLGSSFGRWLYRRFNLSLRVITPSAWGDRSKLTDALFAHLLSPFADPDARAEVLWPLARALLSSEGHYTRLHQDLHLLHEVPTTLVWGMKDHAFPPRTLTRWRAELPHARGVELAASGHWPQEEDPDAVIEAIRSGSVR